MPVKFYLENRPNKKGECMIRVSIMIKSNRLVTSIGGGYTISPNKWDISKQCVKKSSINSRGFSYADINNRINRIASEFQDLESDVLGGRPITKNTLRKMWQAKFCKTPQTVVFQSKLNIDDNSFFGIYDKFIIEEGRVRNWREVVTKKHEKTREQLKEFNPDLQFEDITKEVLADFCTFLNETLKLQNETVLQKFVELRQFFRWAIENQIALSPLVMKFKPKLRTSKKPIVYLEWEELMAVNNLKFTDEEQRHEHIRDCFVFLCFTGLRFSDMYNLKKTDIRNGSIFITTLKTSDALEINLNKYSQAILDKYKDVELPANRALPVPNHTDMNIELKNVMKKAVEKGLKSLETPIKITTFQGNKREDTVYLKSEIIGTHCGRRTFICNAIMLGIAPDIVMKWTGHKHYSAMKPYIEISSKAKAEAMELFNKRSEALEDNL